MEQEEIFERLLHILEQYSQKQKHGQFVEYLDPAELRKELLLEEQEGGEDWDQLFGWVEQYLRYAVKTTHPSYVNRMWAGANLPSIIGEMVTAVTNTSACTYETAPVSTLMEKYMLEVMLKLVGFTNGVGQMTTGSSNANMIAMMAARNLVNSNVKEAGLFGQQELFAFVNANAHYSMDRAAAILGIGIRHLKKIPFDRRGRMDSVALEQKLEEVIAAGGVPFFVAATAGTTVRGAYDPLAPLLALRDKYGFWLHVDGAWGGAAIVSDTLRAEFLQGVEQADSFTVDFHKMLGAALMCNVLLFNKRANILKEICSAGDESYIFRQEPGEEIRDLGTLSLQCGRRVDALKWFLDWKFYGRLGFAHRIEEYLELCRYAEQYVNKTPELEMVVPRESFNVCFRYKVPQGLDANEFNRRLRETMHYQGTSLVGTAYVNQVFTLRLLITNKNIDIDAIDRFMQGVVTTGNSLLAQV